MEEVCSSEILVNIHQTMRHHIPEDGTFEVQKFVSNPQNQLILQTLTILCGNQETVYNVLINIT
jgi:hypothetical protein